MAGRLRALWVVVSIVTAVVPLVAGAADVLYSCPTAGVTGDRIDRGFYVLDYSGLTLGVVTLTYATDGDAGSYTVSLTAHQGTYDGPVLGSAEVTFDQTGGMMSFEFHDVPINSNMTIAFVQALVSGPPDAFVFYDVGPCTFPPPDCTSCPGIVETEDTTAPLSTYRRGSVGLTITGRAITPVAPDSWGGMKALYR
jgi:hypothetical protein